MNYLCYDMNYKKLAEQPFNLSDEIYYLFYHIKFLQACSACSIIPVRFSVNKNPRIGKPNKKLITNRLTSVK